MNRKIVLASSSKQRLNILKALPLTIEVRAAEIDEQAVPFLDQYDKAEQIALAKAKKVASFYQDAIIVAADTFCFLQGRILEKPKTLAQAREMLYFQSGQEIEVLTGFAFLDTKKQIVESGCEKVIVKMRELSDLEIENYVQTQPVLTWSAAFSPAYDSGMALIKSINGNFTAFSHGLPVDLFFEFLQKHQA